MKKITLLFPGQGSQYVGMGKSLEGKPSFNLFSRANQILDYDLSKICFEGPEEELKLTQNTQPAILTHSLALFSEIQSFLDKKGLAIHRVLGHSVGEFAALVAAETLKFEDALKAVYLRGKYMQEAVPKGEGKMIALLKIPNEIVENFCKKCSTENEKVMPANFNGPGQIVISGHTTACDKLLESLKENYTEPYRAVELSVSAPFHSSLMQPAAKKLATFFNEITFNKNDIPYIANIDAKEYPAQTNGAIIKNNLIEQVCGSVRWEQSFSLISENELCLEVGPGKVLMGLGRKINPKVKIIPMDSEDAFAKLEELL
ncbi:MAG: ACP S-malonyltransferase [Halobacteriovoraceae bacterium]|nr:ACP S-malonyltransferase [Halobacteriovoraceae bacterium]